MKEYSKSLEVDSHHQMQFSVIPRTPLGESLTFLHKIQSAYSKPCQQGGCTVKDAKHVQYIMVKVFANGLGNQGSIPGWIIPKTQKMRLDAPCLTLNITRYRSRVKWSNPGKGVAPSPRPWCSSYWKGAFWLHLTTVNQLTTYIYGE